MIRKMIISDIDLGEKPYIAKINIVDANGEVTYGVYVTEIEDKRKIKPKKINGCSKCGKKLNKYHLCGFHSKPICTNCNACVDCFNGVDTI